MVNDLKQNDLEKEAAARASLRFVQRRQHRWPGNGLNCGLCREVPGRASPGGIEDSRHPNFGANQRPGRKLGIPLTTLDEFQQIDVTIDGADEFDPQLNLIKGGGGALLREKIIASASRQVVIIADSSKQVAVLGKFPLPVEVISFAQPLLAKRIAALGASVKVRQDKNGNIFVSDEGHHILDCGFGQIPDPPALARELSNMPGIVEHGLFIGLAAVVLMAKGENVTEFHREKKQEAAR